MSKKVTIRDIAKKLNISKTTVSLALLDKYGVNEDTRAKVVLTAIDMGYNFESLRSRKAKKKILIVLSDRSLLSSPFWNDIISGIENVCGLNNYIIDILAFESCDQSSLIETSIINGNASGVIFLDKYNNQDDYKILEKINIPMVLLDPRNYVGKKLSQANVDNYSVGESVAHYLIKKGHTKLCFVGNTLYARSFSLRYKGFENYIDHKREKLDLSITKINMQDKLDKNNMYAGEELIKAMSVKDRPTAIYCANDVIALSVITQLRERLNLTCPNDYSIVGTDNILESGYSNPSLTTVSIDRKLLGQTCANLLFNELEGSLAHKINMQIYTDLIERNSVKDISDIK